MAFSAAVLAACTINGRAQNTTAIPDRYPDTVFVTIDPEGVIREYEIALTITAQDRAAATENFRKLSVKDGSGQSVPVSGVPAILRIEYPPRETTLCRTDDGIVSSHSMSETVVGDLQQAMVKAARDLLVSPRCPWHNGVEAKLSFRPKINEKFPNFSLTCEGMDPTPDKPKVYRVVCSGVSGLSAPE
jgi:hypothetical protein